MKKILQLATGMLLLVALPATIFIAGQRQEIRKKAAPATTMAIVPPTVSKKVGEVFTIEITIDTGENQVVAAEIHITFDQTKLEAQTITNGSLFPNILASGSVEPGGASITVGAADAKQPVRGTGTIATLTVIAKEQTDSPTLIKLGSNSFVGGLGEGATNVLAGTTPASVTITKDRAQNTPTPPAKQDPAPQGTPTSTTSAQITQTPTPTPTPSVETLKIISPVSQDTATTDKPMIQGKASPGSTVTVTVYSTPQTMTVTADANGNWSLTPQAPLETGPHNIVASVTDQDGKTQTATTEFVVASSNAIGGSESIIPISGTTEITILLILLGVAMLFVGFVKPVHV
ncbi:MAG: Ig-like domain-containing protein [Candidatus Gottesmanbacteria bacterium]|nr:Ig-like domain-containing protein [Candidatus Gottesmanbacteria bacterium]